MAFRRRTGGSVDADPDLALGEKRAT